MKLMDYQKKYKKKDASFESLQKVPKSYASENIQNSSVLLEEWLVMAEGCSRYDN